jgi:hypothetical protein
MNFPSEEKKNNPKQEKPCPQRETEASLQTLRSQRLLVSSDEISCCCTFQRIECGKRFVADIEVIVIADTLGVSLEALLRQDIGK